jgi:hypothetical protein
VGSWAGRALDAYLEARTRAGRPIPLAWHRGVVRVVLDGQEVTLRGFVSLPFGAYRGTAEGPASMGRKRFTPAAVALGKLGGLKGGKARAEKMTPQARRESARNAALARWRPKASQDR